MQTYSDKTRDCQVITRVEQYKDRGVISNSKLQY